MTEILQNVQVFARRRRRQSYGNTALFSSKTAGLKINVSINKNIYFLQSHKLDFLKLSYFYKLVCLLIKDLDQSAQSDQFSALSIRYTASTSK